MAKKGFGSAGTASAVVDMDPLMSHPVCHHRIGQVENSAGPTADRARCGGDSLFVGWIPGPGLSETLSETLNTWIWAWGSSFIRDAVFWHQANRLTYRDP